MKTYQVTLLSGKSHEIKADNIHINSNGQACFYIQNGEGQKIIAIAPASAFILLTSEAMPI